MHLWHSSQCKVLRHDYPCVNPIQIRFSANRGLQPDLKLNRVLVEPLEISDTNSEKRMPDLSTAPLGKSPLLIKDKRTIRNAKPILLSVMSQNNLRRHSLRHRRAIYPRDRLCFRICDYHLVGNSPPRAKPHLINHPRVHERKALWLHVVCGQLCASTFQQESTDLLKRIQSVHSRRRRRKST